MIMLVATVVACGLAQIQKVVEDDDYTKLGMGPDNPAESCREIYNNNPASHGKSGYYWVKLCGTTQKVKARTTNIVLLNK